jgi:hypothetical protein
MIPLSGLLTAKKEMQELGSIHSNSREIERKKKHWCLQKQVKKKKFVAKFY